MLEVIIVVAALSIILVDVFVKQHIHPSEIYADFAKDWDQFRNKVIVQRDHLLSMDIPIDDEDALRFRDQVIERYNKDIQRLADRIEFNTSMVPHRLREKLKCPTV